MKKRLLLVASCVAVLTSNLAAQDGDEPKEALFKYLTEVQLDDDSKRLLDALKADKVNSRFSIVEVNKKHLRKRFVTLNLPDNLNKELTFERQPLREDGDFLAVSAVRKKPIRNITMVCRGADVIGQVHLDTALYTVRPLGNKLHVLIKRDLSKMPDLTDEEHADSAESGAQRQPPDAKVPSNRGASKTTQQIDVMVVYTGKVAQDVKDVELLAMYAIDLTEQSYVASGVLIDLKLVKVMAVNHVEQGTLQFDNDDLLSGSISMVHAQRDHYKADIVILLVASGKPYGVAKTGASEAEAFATLLYPYVDAPRYTFAHEIGHLHGNRHDTDISTHPFADGRGYASIVNGWRTVMASCPPHQERELFWSNPLKQHLGENTGVAMKSDAARVLNHTAPTVAGFR